ncbi:MAG: tannase/feruloyl esterase family alpha/beta hydrolase [Gammaproteobacteria bacterium]
MTQQRSLSWRLLVHADPDWDLLSIDWERDVDAGRKRLGPMYDATNPDLSRFQARGGKLIMYHGWSDPLISPFLSVDMWDAINKRMGADKTAEFARLFMIPGMAHCSSGPVGGTRDMHDAAWLTAIQNWAEDGIAPDAQTPRGTVIGVGAIEGQLRTRPYCPYPRVARYTGAGGIDRAASFTCEMP